MTLYNQLVSDLREYSVFAPPPRGPTKSLVREHGNGVFSFRAVETNPGWLFFDVRSDEVVLQMSAGGDVDVDRLVAFLRAVPESLVATVTEAIPVAVRSTTSSDNEPTDCVAIVHPSVERSSPIPKAVYAMPYIYGVRHCYRCEFTDDDRPEEATYRIRRVLSGVSPTPRPAIQMRFAVTATGVKSTGGKKLGIFEFSMVMRMLADVKSGGGFAEIENWQRHRVNLTCEKGVWQITENKRSWEPFENEVEPWLHAFAFDSYEAAVKLIKR